jgi:SAM-dependent methyltransferase
LTEPRLEPVWIRREYNGSLAEAWEEHAERWVAWVRTPGHDSYEVFHRDVFRKLLPPPPGPALDVGCGEGRFPRDLKSWGYQAVGVDSSQTLIRYALDADPAGEYIVADAAAMPFEPESFPVVTAFMSLHDMDDAAGAVREMARVLAVGGRLCVAIVHPLSSAGGFESRASDARFVIEGSYLGGAQYASTGRRAGLEMTFSSHHRPLHDYFAMLNSAGLLIDRCLEIADVTDPADTRWSRVPLFLQIRAVKPPLDTSA